MGILYTVHSAAGRGPPLHLGLRNFTPAALGFLVRSRLRSLPTYSHSRVPRPFDFFPPHSYSRLSPQVHSSFLSLSPDSLSVSTFVSVVDACDLKRSSACWTQASVRYCTNYPRSVTYSPFPGFSIHGKTSSTLSGLVFRLQRRHCVCSPPNYALQHRLRAMPPQQD